MRSLLLAILALIGPALPAVAGTAASGAAPASPVVFRFATVGDSRADPKSVELDAQDRRWLQNTRVLERIFDEVSAQKMQALVFNGDMVMGYTLDRALLDREYAYWRGMVAGLMEHGTYVLPVPGNHELQMPTPRPDGTVHKLAQPALADAWRDNMGDLIVDAARWQRSTGWRLTGWDAANHPEPGVDGIVSSQAQLSYSLDAGPVHIAVINTDPVDHDSGAPVTWLRRDLEAARGRGAKRIFVFGHKMAFPYEFHPHPADKESGLEVRPAERDAFWDLIEAFGATYFCGHEHIYHASQPRLSQGGRAWQVIVGSGGSPFSAQPSEASRPSDRMYAWAEVAVHADGRTDITVRGFDEALGPTQVIEAFALP